MEFNDVTEILKESKKSTLVEGEYGTSKYACAYFHLKVNSTSNINLVIGAEPKYKCAARFCKSSLQDMINDLQIICNAMEESR